LLGVCEDISIFADYPDHCCFGFWFIIRLHVLEKVFQNSTELLRVLSEDVSHDDDCLLDDVGLLCLDAFL
jgi:hypothetical protein